MHSLLAVLLVVAVLVLVIWQPRGLSIGWPAAIGGTLAVVLGIVSVGDVAQVVRIVWDATLSFVAVILISLVLNAIGFFWCGRTGMAWWHRSSTPGTWPPAEVRRMSKEVVAPGDRYSPLDDARLSRFHWRTVLTAGMGFLTDAYDLFIIGTVTAILGPIWHLTTDNSCG